MTPTNVYQEKAAQAHTIMQELDLDCWLTFVRETVVSPDPGIELVVGADVTWESAFILNRDGTRVAIVGRYDAPGIVRGGIFNSVVSYDQSIRPALLEALDRIAPRSIGLNYSIDDKTADGLTYGMWLKLQSLLQGTPYAERLVSAGPLLTRLRARKTAGEVARIRAAIETTEAIVELVNAQIAPGKSELDIGNFVHAEFQRRGLPSAWAWDGCPIVNSGPESEPGHAGPRADIIIEPGHLVHMDLGVQQDGYCSDIQRMWYVRRPGETDAPPAIQRAFATVIQAIEAGAAVLKPGIRGYEVDAVAREVIIDRGYPEYMHAFGHGLGRACHDGGPLLGPRWDRYGTTPDMIVEAGHVYTLELGVMTEAGYVGIEEDVLVTENGCEFLSTFQRELKLL